MKKVNGLLLGGAMALSLAGVIGATSSTKDVKEVKADDAVLMIGSHDMIASPEFSSGGGTAKYDNSTRTLTLTNFSYDGDWYTYNSDCYTGFYVQGLTDLKIKLSGNNVIKGKYNDNNEWASVAGGVILADTTISALDPTGEKPSLSFVAAQSTVMSEYRNVYGTYCYDSLTLSGVVFNSYTESPAKYSNYGIYGSRTTETLTISNSITRFEASTGGADYGLSAGLGALFGLDFSGSTIRAIGGNAKDSNGILIGTLNCPKVNINESDVEAIGGTATNESTGFVMQSKLSISKSSFVATGESYGLKSKQSSTQTVSIGNDVKRFTLSGKVRAAASNIKLKNAFAGYGWENAEGTGDPSVINVNTSGAVYLFKRISFGKITYTATASEAVTYDGNPHLMMSVTVTDPSTGYSVKYKKDGQTDYSESLPYESEVGTHTVYYQIEANGYTPVSGSVNFTINKASSSWTTLPVGAVGLKYDATEHNLLTTEAVASNGTVTYALNGVQTAFSDLKATDAGTYTIIAHADVDGNHEPLNDIELHVEIEGADLQNVKHVVAGTKEYNGEELIPGFSRAASTPYDVKITWLYSLTEDGEYTNVIPTFTDAGDHVVYWKVTAPNHKPQGGSVVFTITPADLNDVSVSVETSEFVYDGEAKQLSVQTKGTTVDETAVTFKYSLSEDSGYETTLPSLTNAGEYTVYWKAEANNHKTVKGSFDVVINKAESSFKEEPSAIGGLVYTGEPLKLVNAGETDDGVIKYCVGDKEGVYSDVVPTGTEPGSYVVWYMVEGDSNHNNSQPKSVSVIIGENDKTSLNKAIEKADKLHDLIKDKYPEIDTTLATALNEGKTVSQNATAMPNEIADATTKINEACVNTVEKLVESIGEIKNDEQSKESVELARAAYESLSDEQKLLVPEKTLADLEAKESEYKKVTSGLAWWAIALIAVACLVVFFVLLYVLMFYVFHKWIKQDNKAIKVFVCGHKHGKARLLTKSLKVMYRFDEEVFNSKEEALK